MQHCGKTLVAHSGYLSGNCCHIRPLHVHVMHNTFVLAFAFVKCFAFVAQTVFKEFSLPSRVGRSHVWLLCVLFVLYSMITNALTAVRLVRSGAWYADWGCMAFAMVCNLEQPLGQDCARFYSIYLTMTFILHAHWLRHVCSFCMTCLCLVPSWVQEVASWGRPRERSFPVKKRARWPSRFLICKSLKVETKGGPT